MTLTFENLWQGLDALHSKTADDDGDREDGVEAEQGEEEDVVPGEYLPPQELAGVLQAKLQMWDRRCRSPHVCAGCVQSACRVCAGCVQCLCAKWGIAAEYLFVRMFDLRSALSRSLALSLSLSLSPGNSGQRHLTSTWRCPSAGQRSWMPSPTRYTKP